MADIPYLPLVSKYDIPTLSAEFLVGHRDCYGHIMHYGNVNVQCQQTVSPKNKWVYFVDVSGQTTTINTSKIWYNIKSQ